MAYEDSNGHVIDDVTSIACVNHLTTTSALFAISEPLYQMISV